ncbi:Peptidyl-tRNA hydrolase 2, mitochondrial, partial [Stegodyphus mimosarum]
MIEDSLLRTIVTNTCAVGCGVFLGFIIKGWLKNENNSNSSQAYSKGALEEEIFSDLVQGDHKLVLVVQNGLKMGKGKIAAQCSHASVMAYRSCSKTSPETLRKWLKSGQRKVVVKVDDEEALLAIANAARQHFNVNIVCDAGRTQIPSGSKTVLAIGPGPENLIDSITGHLKLL